MELRNVVPALHRTIVLVDVEKFGDDRRTDRHQVVVRAALYESLHRAFRDSGIPWHACYHEDRGDGVFILVPPEIPKAHVVARLPNAVALALAAHNATRPEAERLRLRMAVHAGEVQPDDHGYTSAAITLAFRLLDAPPLRTALADSPGVLVLIASSWFYDEVVRNSTLDPATFRPVDVEVKEVVTTAWIARPDHPYPPLRNPVSTGTRVAAAVSAVVLSACALAADSRPGSPGVEVSGVGRDLAGSAEFLAYVVNLATDKCISRNGPYTHPGDSERPGQAIYQWDCEDSHNPGHVVVLAPVAGGWLIRSSARADLCLEADGIPGKHHYFRRCHPDDDRQLWRLRQVRGKPTDTVVIENRDTRTCIAHQGGRPDVHISIVQRACRPLGDDEVAWSIKPYALAGRRDCAGPVHGRLRNQETGRDLAASDRPDLASAPASGPAVSFVPAGDSAHGCRMSVVGPADTCLSPTTPGWSPCDDQPAGRWIVEWLADEGDRSWLRLHSGQDFSRCLATADDGPPSTRLCDDSPRQQWRLE